MSAHLEHQVDPRQLPPPAAAAAVTRLLDCTCPVRIVAGAAWAYQPQRGWHPPAEHDERATVLSLPAGRVGASRKDGPRR